MKTIRFRSKPKYWIKEYQGLKPNTERVFDKEDDVREEILREFMYGHTNTLTIEIQNTKTGEVFSRRVTDVSQWNKIYVISWFHSPL